jgi:N-acetyl-anhydromuramyl-L-alanine amidase AmpD
MIKLDYLPYVPAACKSSRNGTKITHIVIHAMQGYYGQQGKSGTIFWFQNPKSRVSAHYLVSKKGEITCMVKDDLKAWAAGDFNPQSLNIELEDMSLGVKGDCRTLKHWWTDAELKAAAELTATLMLKHKIPLTNVIGHNDKLLREHFGSTHEDPGPAFPWPDFKALIQGYLDDGSKPK